MNPNELKLLYNYIVKQLEVEQITPIGSSRLILNDTITKNTKDLDVCVLTDKSIEEFKQYCIETFKPQKINIYFGTEISMHFNFNKRNGSRIEVPTEYLLDVSNEAIHQSVQVDIQIANTPEQFYYLSEFKFYSNEPYYLYLGDENLKGLHEQILLRTILKFFGFSHGNNGLVRFKRNDVLDHDFNLKHVSHADVNDERWLMRRLSLKLSNSQMKKKVDELFDKVELTDVNPYDYINNYFRNFNRVKKLPLKPTVDEILQWFYSIVKNWNISVEEVERIFSEVELEMKYPLGNTYFNNTFRLKLEAFKKNYQTV